MKILVTNSVPLNGGDEALLRATYLSLQKALPQAEITVLCSNLELCRKYITDINLDSDLEYLRPGKPRFKYFFFQKIRKILLQYFKIGLNSKFSLLLANEDEIRIKKLYRECDIVISSPGGFLHDHYPIVKRIEGFKLAFQYKKPVVIFSQSVGPFWKDESVALIQKEFKNLAAIILREKISYKYLSVCNVASENVHITSDAAFLWRKLMPDLFVAKTGRVNSIALCFRNWPVINNQIEETISKAVDLCNFLLQDEDRELIFISTCQGIEGYVDDSVHADAILARLSSEKKIKCKIDRQRYSPVDLIKAYSQYDAFIGMRLHSAILSMLGGTPAMGLGYEDKTLGIFEDLGFKKFQVSYDCTSDEWIVCAKNFINEIEFIRNRLPKALDELADIAMQSISITKYITQKI